MNKISFKLVWFDSFGAKSTCLLVETPDVKVLIDPGVAIMQPSFPAALEDKLKWKEEGRKAIKKASENSEVIVISHYHYDHFTDFDRKIYEEKTLFVKNPNEYINDSQRRRAEKFLDNYLKAYGKTSLASQLKKRVKRRDYDPFENLSAALERDYGDYSERKKELMEEGKKWFLRRVERWNKWKIIPEFRFKNEKLFFADGREFRFGETRIRFTRPFFHGIEFSRVGWVVSTVITCGGEKIIHSSDLQGPVIEDQANWIISENPDVLVLDGPSTYLIPYMFNLINLRRTVENVCRIISSASNLQLVIYDHHLPRDPNYREWVGEIYSFASEKEKKVLTAAEYLGRKPTVLQLTQKKGSRGS